MFPKEVLIESSDDEALKQLDKGSDNKDVKESKDKGKGQESPRGRKEKNRKRKRDSSERSVLPFLLLISLPSLL